MKPPRNHDQSLDYAEGGREREKKGKGKMIGWKKQKGGSGLGGIKKREWGQ